MNLSWHKLHNLNPWLKWRYAMQQNEAEQNDIRQTDTQQENTMTLS